jgi:tetratricopeptide (TPR) repeat protein
MRDVCIHRQLAQAAAALRGIALLLGFGLVACNTDIQSGIESANDLLYKKQYVAAERLYHKLLKRLGEEGELSERQEPQRLLILDRLGKVNALYLHDYGQAIHFYEKLVQLYPKTEQAFAARAMVADIYHHKLGNLQSAIAEYQKLVADFPDKPETRWAQLQISGAFFQLKDYEQARTEAEAVVNRWPASIEAAQARFQIANAYYVQGRYSEAIATYERLLEGNPDAELASLVLFELGNCFQELGDLDRALAYYYACLADHPNPLLVQRKIRRVRARLHHMQPPGEIALPEYVLKRLATAQSARTNLAATTTATGGRVRERADEAPEAGVMHGSRFDESEGEVRAQKKGAARGPRKGAAEKTAGTADKNASQSAEVGAEKAAATSQEGGGTGAAAHRHQRAPDATNNGSTAGVAPEPSAPAPVAPPSARAPHESAPAAPPVSEPRAPPSSGAETPKTPPPAPTAPAPAPQP